MVLICDGKLRRAVHLALTKAVEYGWEYEFYPLENVLKEIPYWVDSDYINELKCSLNKR